MNILKNKIDEILNKKGLSRHKLSQLIEVSDGTLSKMTIGKRPFSKNIKEKILPILEVSEEEFESWTVADKYPKELIKKAIESSFQSHSELNSASAQLVFTQNIDKILKEKNMSRTALAKSIKYNQPDVNRMIVGKMPISNTVLTRISEFFEIPKEDLQAWVLADRYSLEILEWALKIFK